MIAAGMMGVMGLTGCATIKQVGHFIKPPIKFKPSEMARGKRYMIDFATINQYPVLRPAVFESINKTGWYRFCESRKYKVCFLVPPLRVLKKV